MRAIVLILAATVMHGPDHHQSIALPDAVIAALEPPERLTVSEWSDRYRYLGERSTSEPGPWRTARVPYARRPMDVSADPRVSRITMIKGAQCAGTEICYNIIARRCDEAPLPMLVMLDTKESAEEEFSGRFRRLFEDSERLSRLRISANEREWATAHHIRLFRNDIYCAWPKTVGRLTRKAIGLVMIDELDQCAQHAGSHGDNVGLVLERMTTFGQRGLGLIVSTPTYTGAPTDREWRKSDQERYHCPCPHCGEYQTLRDRQIKIPDDVRKLPRRERVEVIRATRCAWYECEFCRRAIEEEWHAWMIDRGVWVPAAQEIVEPLDVRDLEQVRAAALPYEGRWEPRREGEPLITSHLGFHIPSTISPWRRWSLTLARWFEVVGDPEQERVYHNSWLGEPWEVKQKVTTREQIEEKAAGSDYQQAEVPDDAMVLLAGADVQRREVYFTIRAWGRDGRSWLIRHDRVLSLDDLIEQVFRRDYRVVGRERYAFRTACLAIDCNYQQGIGTDVYDFVERYGAGGHGPVYGVFGRSQVDYWFKPNQPEKETRPNLTTWLVATDRLKDQLHMEASRPSSHEGYWALPRDATPEYFDHIVSEVPIWDKKKGRWDWQPVRQNEPNHWLDCEIYALFLARLLRVGELIEPRDLFRLDAPDRTGDAPPGERAKPWFVPPEEGWV